MITPLDYLGAALLLLLLILPLALDGRAYRRAKVVPELPDLNADLRKDWQTPARRLKLACLNAPAAKGFTQARYGMCSPDGDGQAMTGVSVTTQHYDQHRESALLKPNSPQLGPHGLVRSSEGGAVTIPRRSLPRQTEAGSEPAASLSTPPSTGPARTDPGRRPLPVAVGTDGRSLDHQATVVAFTARKGTAIH